MTVVNALLGLAVLVYVVAQQMRTQPVTTRRLRLAGILGLIGVLQMRSFAGTHAVPAVGWALLLTGLALGAGIGVWRAYSMRLWSENGQALTKGTWLTAGLWVLGMAAHVGVDLLTHAIAPAADAVGSASILLFVAVSLGAQALTVQQRVRVIAPQAVLAGR